MFGAPLHSPRAKHSDRRGGVATAQLREALRSESGGLRPATPRPVLDRARSYQKLIARRTWSPSTRALRLLIVGTLGVLTGLVGRALWVADELVPFAQRPDEYMSLVALVTDRCETGECVVRHRDIRSQPPDVGRLMHRLRVQSIEHEFGLGRTTLRGGYRASYRLEHLSTPSPQQVRWRAADAEWHARESRWSSPPVTTNLGGGWAQVGSR